MGRYDLTEKEWRAIKPHLPNKSRGVPRVDDRRVLNGILYRDDLDGKRAAIRMRSLCRGWLEDARVD